MEGTPCFHGPTKFDESEIGFPYIFFLPLVSGFCLIGIVNTKKSKHGKEKRIVSAVLLTTFAFVLVCAAGFFPCPKIGFTNGEPDLGASKEFVMPCHSDSQEEATSNGKSNGDSCQCD